MSLSTMAARLLSATSTRGEGTLQKMKANLMNLVKLMNSAPRCSATSKRSRLKCRAPAVRGWKVCRFHGAWGGAPKGKANVAWRHGRYTEDTMTVRREVTQLLRIARKTAASIR